MDSVFILNINTLIEPEAVGHPAVEYARGAFLRDMGNIFFDKETEYPTKILLCQNEDGELPPESYSIDFPDIYTMRITGSDPLGVAYGLYFVSEYFLGIHPFWYWNDQVFEKTGDIQIPVRAYRSPRYRVRFRGWFANDEVLIDGWGAQSDSHKHWEMVFEALLRCGGNMTIPGTGENSRKNRKLAADIGLWITHHHAEPLGAEMFLRAFPDKIPSYDENAELFRQLWESAIHEHGDCKVIWNLGFRGQGDRPFWNDDPRYSSPERRGELISRVIADQYCMLKKHYNNPVCCTNLYGEIMELYRQGFLKLPDSVIKIWADNGYGRMVSRRQWNHNPRVDALPTPADIGPHGVYYHCSFHDLQASNHLTMSPNSAGFMSNELQTAFKAGAGELLVVNCGSVRPHLYPLDLMRVHWRDGSADPESHRDDYVRDYYSGYLSHIREISGCLLEYAVCAIQYGPNGDDRAGEQIYHHPVRELLCGWLSGKTQNPIPSLLWLTGGVSFENQVKCLRNLCLEALPGWERLNCRCRRIHDLLGVDAKQLFSDSVMLQVKLHLSGTQSVVAFCDSYLAYASGNLLGAFVAACRAVEAHSAAIDAMEAACHDKWRGYYDNDCLTDIRLTRECLRTLAGYLRVLGDGPAFHNWERKYLLPTDEQGVALISTVRIHLSDEQLYLALKESL